MGYGCWVSDIGPTPPPPPHLQVMQAHPHQPFGHGGQALALRAWASGSVHGLFGRAKKSCLLGPLPWYVICMRVCVYIYMCIYIYMYIYMYIIYIYIYIYITYCVYIYKERTKHFTWLLISTFLERYRFWGRPYRFTMVSNFGRSGSKIATL